MSRIDVENAKILRKAMDITVSVGDLEFSNSNIVSCKLTLRGPNEVLDTGKFSLESSEIDIKVKVTGDSDYWITFVSEFDEGEEITYSAGYSDDMSDERVFYLTSASFDSSTSILQLVGSDATTFKLEKDYGGKFIQTTYATVRAQFYDAMKDVLDDADIDYTEAGTVPSGTGASATNIFIPKSKSRDILAQASGLYKNGTSLAITYRDAGRPQLIAGDAVTLWNLDEADLAEFYADVERNVKEYDVTLTSYLIGSTEQIASVNDCVSGSTYIATSNDPIYAIGTTTNCTATLIGLYTIKIVCTTSGTCTVNGQKIVSSTLEADAPRQIVDSQQNGIVVDLGTWLKLQANTGSLTALAVDDLLDASPSVYKFKYRGDPRMQPCDILRIQRITAGNLVPSDTLYPNDTLYPAIGNTIDLRVKSITLEHSDGGLISTIEARTATIYEAIGLLYPSEILYPSETLYPY